MEQVFYRLGNTNNNFQYPCERFEFTKCFIWAALGKAMIGLGFFLCVCGGFFFLFVCFIKKMVPNLKIHMQSCLVGLAAASPWGLQREDEDAPPWLGALPPSSHHKYSFSYIISFLFSLCEEVWLYVISLSFLGVQFPALSCNFPSTVLNISRFTLRVFLQFLLPINLSYFL